MSIEYTLETITKRAHEIMNTEAPYSEEDIEDIRGVILSFALSEIDFNLAEALCEKFIKGSDKDLKWISIICVGHIARVYRRAVNSSIMEEIYQVYKEATPKLWEAAEIALEDVEFFLKNCKLKILKL